MMIIFKSQQYWVQWYVFKQVTSGHDINRSFVWKFDHAIIWKFGVTIRVQDQATAYNKVDIIWNAISCRLSKCNLIHYKGEPLSWAWWKWLAFEIGRMPGACHEFEPITSHQLNISWQTMVWNPCIFDHQWMLDHFTQQLKVCNSETRFWDLKLRQIRVLVIELYFLVGNLGDYVQTPGYKYSELRMQDFGQSLGQHLGKT